MPLRFATCDTPIGTAVAVLSDAGLAALRFTDDDPEHVLSSLLLPRTAVLVHDDPALAAVFLQLEEYFDGARRTFDLRLDLSSAGGFVRAALEAIRAIPYGETASYGEVAVRAGAPGAARAVGTACARTPLSVVVPVHRVVRADGSIGQYGADPDAKRLLLDLEAHALALRSPSSAASGAGR